MVVCGSTKAMAGLLAAMMFVASPDNGTSAAMSVAPADEGTSLSCTDTHITYLKKKQINFVKVHLQITNHSHQHS